MTPNNLIDIHALADGELHGEDKSQASDRLQSCASSRAEYESVLLLKQTLKQKCSAPAHDESWKSCRDRLDLIDKTKRAETFVGKYAWALCGVFLFTIISAAVFNRTAGGNVLNAADMTNVVSGMSPLALPSASGPSALKQWMNKILGRAPVQIEPQLQLRSVRQGWVNGRRAARFDFVDQKGPLALVVLEETDGVEGAELFGKESKYYRSQMENNQVLGWCEKGYGLFLISPRSIDELVPVAERLRVNRSQ